jgi:hypothetical protein
MRKILSCLLLIVCFAYPLSIFAQVARPKHFCGLSHDHQEILYKNMMELRARYGDIIQTRGAVSYVPMVLHLVANSSGVGRVSEPRLLDFINGLNATYARNGIELQFYIKYLNYINNTDLFEKPKTFDGISVANNNKRSDAMNIYFCGTIGDGTIQGGTELGVYFPTSDWIYVLNNEVNNGATPTIEHEIGHFFSLPHTFRGFDEEPFTASVARPCAPRTMNFRGDVITTENAARTGTDANCSTAGDGFCDTPADYNLGFNWSTCNYTGVAKDPTCVAVDPDEKNLMGYFPTSCTVNFSPMQKNAMMNDYMNSSRRQYIRNGNRIPSLTEMTEANLISPAHNSAVSSFTPINLDWSDVAGVTGGNFKESGYILEISTVISFLGNNVRILTPNSNVTLNSTNTPSGFLKASTRYYWRVRAYGTYRTGGSFSNYNSFVTGTANAVNEIQGIKDFTVSPNPTAAARQLSIALTTEKPISSVVKIYNVAGQVLINEIKRFDTGFSNQMLDIQGLNKGVYILTIEAENGILNKKVVVTE